ncbi:MAG: hypothetical protein M3Z25_24560 [Actinomycetota bacterium]|nr:hypothetical protein [Actinomycetota bacterium]
MELTLLSYLLVLLLGTGLTVTVGTVLRRSGRAVLGETYPEPRATDVARLVTVGFYLFALGVLALISTMDVPVDGVVQTVVTKLGVVLLVLGGAYALTLVVLGRLRGARRRAEFDQEFSAAMGRRAA